MNRRDLLKSMAATLGSTIALPESVFAKMGEPFDPAELDFFRPAQRAQVAMLAEAIIPKTDTPGAIDAGVPGWIEVIVRDCFSPADQKVITDGLTAITRSCQEKYGKSIAELTPDEQVAFLTAYDQETTAARYQSMQKARQGEEFPLPFLQQFKELTKFTFASSEVGATQAFEYMLVPGQWIPDMPLKPDQKAWAIPY